MKFDGIIFDLDGTLWDSCRTVAESWGITLERKYGVKEAPTADDVAGIMGLTVQGIADRLFSGYGAESLDMCRACINDEPAYLSEHGGDIYPGVEEMLDKLSRRAKLFIVSNCEDGYIRSFLTWSGCGRFFTDFECEGRTGLGKAGNIQLIIRRNGIEMPVYIGDTSMDEKSAGEAGCLFVHAAYGFGKADKPVAVAASPLELPGILESLC